MSGTVKRFPPVLALGAAFGAFQSAFFVFGNRIDTYKEEDDEFERKEIMRRTTRVPIQQTIQEIGEGRSTRTPDTIVNSPQSLIQFC